MYQVTWKQRAPGKPTLKIGFTVLNALPTIVALLYREDVHDLVVRYREHCNAQWIPIEGFGK